MNTNILGDFIYFCILFFLSNRGFKNICRIGNCNKQPDFILTNKNKRMKNKMMVFLFIVLSRLEVYYFIFKYFMFWRIKIYY